MARPAIDRKDYKEAVSLYWLAGYPLAALQTQLQDQGWMERERAYAAQVYTDNGGIFLLMDAMYDNDAPEIERLNYGKANLRPCDD